MSVLRVKTTAERKRLFEIVAMVVITILLISLSRMETKLFDLSETLARNQEQFVTTVVYFGLINFNVILILVLSFLLFRNVAKLVVERRRGVFGSKLRSKLVAVLVFFALAPTILLFYISSRYIITSFDEWFSEKVRATMQETREAGARVYKQDQKRLESLARIALQRVKVVRPEEQFMRDQSLILPAQLEGFDAQYGLDNIKVFDAKGRLIWSSGAKPTKSNDANKKADVNSSNGILLAIDPFVMEALGRFSAEPGLWSMSTVVGSDQQDVVKGVAPISHPVTHQLLGLIMTETRFETQILKSIESIQQSFANIRPSAQLIKWSYLVLLVVMSLLIIFSAVWLGFYVARGITGPILSLSEATREVALGNYSVSLAARTEDEAGQLVRSFNLMTKDLQSHRSAADASRIALVKSNEELDQRRKYMEVVLKNITAGVISIDQTGYITSVNSAAEALLGVEAHRVIHHRVEQGLGAELHKIFWKPLEEKLQQTSACSAQIDLSSLGRNVNLLVDGTRIVDENEEELGIILVFDDATEQVKVQRAAAWREVARRIAHEIKNPVTPIKLSAQRLLRRFNDRFTGEEREVFESCLETILKQVDSLRDLVNEFSKFARLPAIQPRPASINQVITDVVNLYQMSYPHVQFDIHDLGKIPDFSLDKDQMNRVIVNLVDNAVAALDGEGGKGKIDFRTLMLPDLDTVRIEITDNGHGIPANLRDRVVEPYFSTKDEGTGLGLAIVNQIIADHGGYLRILPNEPRGTKVIIELPAGLDQNGPNPTAGRQRLS
jgi:two-component system nitrogen regulation sensor histidine kinase NtrY